MKRGCAGGRGVLICMHGSLTISAKNSKPTPCGGGGLVYNTSTSIYIYIYN